MLRNEMYHRRHSCSACMIRFVRAGAFGWSNGYILLRMHLLVSNFLCLQTKTVTLTETSTAQKILLARISYHHSLQMIDRHTSTFISVQYHLSIMQFE